MSTILKSGTTKLLPNIKKKTCRKCFVAMTGFGRVCKKCQNIQQQERRRLLFGKKKEKLEKKKARKKDKKENNTRLLKKKLDIVFSEYIRRKSADGLGMITCPCCGTRIPWQKSQNMHYNSRSKMSTRYDEMNCYAGCMRCNVMLNGNYPAFTSFLLIAYGAKWLQELITKGNQIKQWQAWELKQDIEHYKLCITSLDNPHAR